MLPPLFVAPAFVAHAMLPQFAAPAHAAASAPALTAPAAAASRRAVQVGGALPRRHQRGEDVLQLCRKSGAEWGSLSAAQQVRTAGLVMLQDCLRGMASDPLLLPTNVSPSWDAAPADPAVPADPEQVLYMERGREVAYLRKRYGFVRCGKAAGLGRSPYTKHRASCAAIARFGLPGHVPTCGRRLVCIYPGY